MKIWVFQTGEPLPIDGDKARPMRAINLTNALIQSGHQVMLWSTDFYHQEKRHRYGEYKKIRYSDQLEIRLIDSPGYTKNIGLGRLWDHAILAKNLNRILKNETALPDVIFLGYPPIETASVLSAWSKRNNIPVLLDIKDQWPSLFIEVFPRSLRPFFKLLFWHYFFFARKAMLDSRGYSTMAPGFLHWARDFSGRELTRNDAVFPLTAPMIEVSDEERAKALEWWSSRNIRDDDRPKICFVGSISQAFDFEPIKRAAERSLQQNSPYQFIICGDGGVVEEVKSMMAGLGNVFFPGWIDKPKIVSLFSMSVAALAPYKNTENFIANMPNKILDYLSFGLPILTALEGEVRNLLDEHKVGLSYGGSRGQDLYDCIGYLCDQPEERKKMSMQAKKLYQEHFSYDYVYGGLVKHLEYLARIDR